MFTYKKIARIEFILPYFTNLKSHCVIFPMHFQVEQTFMSLKKLMLYPTISLSANIFYDSENSPYNDRQLQSFHTIAGKMELINPSKYLNVINSGSIIQYTLVSTFIKI